MKNDSSKFQLLKLSIKEFGYMLFSYVQYSPLGWSSGRVYDALHMTRGFDAWSRLGIVHIFEFGDEM